MKSPEKHPVNQKSPEKGKAKNGDSSQMGDLVSSRSKLRRFAELFPQFFDEIKNSEKCKELKVGSQSKQPNSQAIVRDRISELPDALVCHILSFLSTKDYVRTSILSSRWRKIWTSVPNLDFDRRDIDDPVGFLSIVDRVLSFRGAAPIHKFRVHCYVTDFSVIDRWIRTAVGCHVVEFDLYVGSILNQAVEFPESLFLCSTLVVLKLNSYGLRFNPPQSGCFPSLKFFHFTACHPDNESMEKLFSCCPVLEDLTIDGVTGPDVLNFKISAPALKKLRISLRAGDFNGDPNNFYIKAPKLEKLDVAEDVLSNYTMESANSLVEAIVNLYHHETGLQLNFSILSTGLLQGISNVTYLSLSAHLLEVQYLPAAFDNLRKLDLVLHSCHNCKFLAELLKKSSNLEDLVLEYNEDVCTTYSEGEEDEEPEAYVERGCYTPGTVPICFSSHLKSITIRGFRGDDDEMLLAQYFIENGEVLNKVTIYTGALLMKRGDIYKEFATFRRGSRTCRVELL